MESFVDERNNLFDELWAKTVGASDWTNQFLSAMCPFWLQDIWRYTSYIGATCYSQK